MKKKILSTLVLASIAAVFGGEIHGVAAEIDNSKNITQLSEVIVIGNRDKERYCLGILYIQSRKLDS